MFWLLKPAKIHNDAAAQYNIALIYFNGKGNVSQDYEQALHWLLKSAKNNDIEAPNQLGYMYEMGYCVDKDYKLALQYHTQAANMGNEIAQHNIGTFYKIGLGYSKTTILPLCGLRRLPKMVTQNP